MHRDRRGDNRHSRRVHEPGDRYRRRAARVVPYSSWVQQPMRATAVLGRHPHTLWAAPVDREQGRASGLHPEGQARIPLAPLGQRWPLDLLVRTKVPRQEGAEPWRLRGALQVDETAAADRARTRADAALTQQGCLPWPGLLEAKVPTIGLLHGLSTLAAQGRSTMPPTAHPVTGSTCVGFSSPISSSCRGR